MGEYEYYEPLTAQEIEYANKKVFPERSGLQAVLRDALTRGDIHFARLLMGEIPRVNEKDKVVGGTLFGIEFILISPLEDRGSLINIVADAYANRFKDDELLIRVIEERWKPALRSLAGLPEESAIGSNPVNI